LTKIAILGYGSKAQVLLKFAVELLFFADHKKIISVRVAADRNSERVENLF
jgi:hypothetical protein